jgi:hypothetical protein
MTNVLKEAAHLKVAATQSKTILSLGEKNLSFGFDDEEDSRFRHRAVSKLSPCLVQIWRHSFEYDLTRKFSNEMETSFALDKAEFGGVVQRS